MTELNKSFLFFLFFFYSLSSYSQEDTIRNYIILTVEEDNSLSPHPIFRSFWIIPEDSIDVVKPVFSPLLLWNYGKNDVDSSCAAVPFDPHITLNAQTKLLDSIQIQARTTILELIYKKRKRLLTVSKKWPSNSIKLNYYVSPVSGEFCTSIFLGIGRQRTGYAGKLYIPFSDISFNNLFWKSPNAVKLENMDFSTFYFGNNIMYNTLPPWIKWK